MGKYFGTDGFRGEANVDLTVDHAYKIGRFLGFYYSSEHTANIVIGKDTRRSSYMFEYALVAGITASGANAYLMHVTTTPSVSYAVRTEDFDCGIMISASHNAYYDNGIKLINGKGEKLEEEVIERIERYIDFEEPYIELAKGEKIGRAQDFSSARNRYIGYLISIPVRSFKGIRVGLDCANGSASNIAKNVFDALGAKTYTIHDEPDGININENCGSTHIEDLARLVKEKKLDVGFAYDGDADRCLCIDENGELVDGDAIMYVLGSYMKDNQALDDNTVVTTIMSNIGLYKAFDAIHIRYEKTAVGDKYVYEEMTNNGYKLGGEQSGHIIISKYATTGDGILTSIKMMEVMVEKRLGLSALKRPLTIYPQKLVNIKVKDKEAILTNKEVKDIIQKVESELGDDGRVLVRASGTENLLRVMVEASTDELCESKIEAIMSVIKDGGHLVE